MNIGSRDDLCKHLARVLVSFQDQYMANEQQSAPTGLLCQVWLPHSQDNGLTVQLQTKGQPFFIAGSRGADLLALFRCLSCRYEFGTDQSKPRELGAPGRVFISSKPECSRNVQQMASSDYHRQPSAKLCSVQSCILFPVFDVCSPGKSLAIVEIVQNNDQMDFLSITRMILDNLIKHGMTSSSLEDVGILMGQPQESPKFQMVQDLNAALGPFDFMNDTVLSKGDANMAFVLSDSDGSGNLKGFVSTKDSRRLGVSSSRLKTLMKTKKIKTLPKLSMAKYEQDVNLSLTNQLNDNKLHKVPSYGGLDSRWKRVHDIPSTAEPEDDNCPDGAFPIQPSRSGRLKYWSRKSSSNSARNSPQGFATLPSMLVEPNTANKGSLSGQSDEQNRTSLDNSGNINDKDTKTESDDWIGMIDPAMLELMMTEDFGSDLGDIGDMTGLP